MGRSSIKYIDTNYMYGAPAVSAPVTNPVIYGRFPKHFADLSSADKLNKFLSGILLCLVVLSLVSYYFVSDCERRMNKLGKEIVALNNENIELQNKLDNLNSFNRVDSIIHGSTMLDTAKKVIEIPSIASASTSSKKISMTPVNYNWSIGY